MQHQDLQRIVEGAFENRDQIGLGTRGEIRDAVEATLDLLDRGTVRVAEAGKERRSRYGREAVETGDSRRIAAAGSEPGHGGAGQIC